jgi:WD40 repeat protein
MHVRRLGLGLVLVLGLALSTAAQEGKKPVPAPAAQAKVAKLIRELYGDELAKAAKDPAAKLRLAQTLLQEGRDTIDDPAGRYVLLKEAHQLAAEAGDVATALHAAEELAQHFQIPSAELFQTTVKTLTTAANAPQAPRAAYETVVDSALILVEDTLAADDFASSLALLKAADRAAIKLRNVSLVASIRKREEEVRALQKEYAQWAPAAERLAKNPTDPQANYDMGYYYALIKGNWDKGLPMLARGNGPAADAAKLELGQSKGAAPLESADRWYTFAQHAKGLAHLHGLVHAYQVYLRDLPTADAAQRETIEGRLREINKALPVEYRAGEITVELRRIDVPPGPVYDATFSPDGRKIVGGAYDGSVRLWDSRTGKEQRRLEGHLGKIWTVTFHPDGRHVVSGGFDGSVRLWDLASARELKHFPGHTDYVRSVCVSADGKRIISGGDDRLLRLWDIETGKEVRSYPGHDHFVWSVALSRDGKRALSASLDKTVRLWDVQTGEQLKKLVGHRDTVLGVAFTPDGRHALSGSTDKTLILWDLETGKPVRTFTGHTGYVQHVAVSPDGRFALSASADHTVRLWDLATGAPLRTLDGHRDQVWSVAFARNGRLALSAGQDSCVRVWGNSR